MRTSVKVISVEVDTFSVAWCQAWSATWVAVARRHVTVTLTLQLS